MQKILRVNVYVNHYTILKGYLKNKMIKSNPICISRHCFLHGTGGLFTGRGVGVDP